MNKQMKLTLRPNILEVQIVDEREGENAPVREYELREMDAAKRDSYLNQLNERFRLNKEGVAVGMKNFTGLQAALLILTLFDKAENKPVTVEQVQKWPASTVSQLFKAAKELNHLEEDQKTAEEIAAKNA